MWIGNGYESEFRPQGGVLNGGPALTSMLVEEDIVPVEIVTGSDNQLWVRTESNESSNAAWRRLSNDFTSCRGAPGAVTYFVPGDGADLDQVLTVGCRGSDNALWYASAFIEGQNVPFVNGWQSLGGILEAGPAVGLVVTWVVTGQGGRVWINDSGESGNTAYRSTTWICRGRPAVGSEPLQTAGTDADTGTAWFGCHGTDDTLWVARNDDGNWDDAFSRGGILREGVGAAVAGDQAVFFVRGTDDAIWQTTVYNGNFTPTPFVRNPSAIRFDPGATVVE
jgi:hypothetical protein